MKRPAVIIILLAVGTTIPLIIGRFGGRSPLASAGTQSAEKQPTSAQINKRKLSQYMRNAGLGFVEETGQLVRTDDVHEAKVEGWNLVSRHDHIEINLTTDDDKKFLDALDALHTAALIHATAVTMPRRTKASTTCESKMNSFYFDCDVILRTAISEGEYEPTKVEKACGWKENQFPSCDEMDNQMVNQLSR